MRDKVDQSNPPWAEGATGVVRLRFAERLSLAGETPAHKAKCHSANLVCLRLRRSAGLPVYLEQLPYSLQPILQIASSGAATLNIDLKCAQFDFFTCWMALGSLWSLSRGRRFSCELGHTLPLLAKVCSQFLLLGKIVGQQSLALQPIRG